MRIEDIDPADVPDEPRLPRPPDGPTPPGRPQSPDSPPLLPDSAERETIRRAYQDLVNGAYADYPQGTSDVPEKPATGDLLTRQKELPLLRTAGGNHLHQQAERTEAAVQSGPEPKLKGEESLYCPVSELKGDEPGTALRLMESREFTGGTLQGFKDPTGNPDYIDEYKRTYDAVGGPSAWTAPELDMNGMINQIKRHLYQKAGVDFTVLDLTGASSRQIDKVFESLDVWAVNSAMRSLSKLIIVGEGF